MSTDFLNSFAAPFSDAGIDHILDPLLHQRGDLRCLHIFIVIVVQRFQEMNLDRHRLYRVCVKRFKRIYKRHRYNRALRFCRRFEASAFKRPDMVAVFGSRSLSEDQSFSPSSLLWSR